MGCCDSRSKRSGGSANGSHMAFVAPSLSAAVCLKCSANAAGGGGGGRRGCSSRCAGGAVAAGSATSGPGRCGRGRTRAAISR